MRLTAQMTETDLPGQITILHPTLDGVVLGQEMLRPGQEHGFGTLEGVRVAFVPGEMQRDEEGLHVFVPYTGEQIADVQAAAVRAAEANGIALGEARAHLRAEYDTLSDVIAQAQEASDVDPDALAEITAQRERMREELIAMGVVFDGEDGNATVPSAGNAA